MSSKRYTEKFKVEVVKQSSGNCSHYDQQRTAGRPLRPLARCAESGCNLSLIRRSALSGHKRQLFHPMDATPPAHLRIRTA